LITAVVEGKGNAPTKQLVWEHGFKTQPGLVGIRPDLKKKKTNIYILKKSDFIYNKNNIVSDFSWAL
jgi:hypothetical protein